MKNTIKVAKVIATGFFKRSVRLKTYICGNPLLFMGHSQNFTDFKSIKKLILLHVKLEKKYNPGSGICRDLIIVSSQNKSEKEKIFLKKITNQKIPNGQIKVLQRKNFGMSYGAYNDAFKKFRNNYDYFLFGEDDWLIYGNNYLKTGIDILKNNKKIGYLAYQAKTKINKQHCEALNIAHDKAFSCHSSSGLGRVEVLNKIFNKYKMLPHSKNNNYFDCIRFGEVKFGNSFYKLGYEIADLPKEITLGMPAYDYMRNVNYKKYPSYMEKIFLYYFKIKFLNKLKKLIWKIVSRSTNLQILYLRILKLYRNDNYSC